MSLDRKHIALLVLAGFIGAYWAAALMLPGFIARQQGAQIVQAYSKPDGVYHMWRLMPCMPGGGLVFDMRLDESRHQWIVDQLQGERLVSIALDADLFMGDLIRWCRHHEGSQLGIAYVPWQASSGEGGREQLKWVSYQEGARQVKTFPLAHTGEQGSYGVDDWNDEWALLDQSVLENGERLGGVGLLNLRSGQYTVPVPGQHGDVTGATLVADGFVYCAGEDIYFYDLNTRAHRKIGKRGWYLFAAQGTTVAWVTREQPSQVVVHDLKTDQEWRLDGSLPFLVGNKVIRTVVIGTAQPGDKPAGAEIVVSNRDGTQRRVLARTARYDTDAVYYNGRLYYLDEIPNLKFPVELVNCLMNTGAYCDYESLGTTKLLFAKSVDLNQN